MAYPVCKVHAVEIKSIEDFSAHQHCHACHNCGKPCEGFRIENGHTGFRCVNPACERGPKGDKPGDRQHVYSGVWL